MVKLDEQLAGIADLPRADLRRRWVNLTGRTAPKLSKKMLRMALGYEIQAKALGGLSANARRQLEGPALASPRAIPLAPGMRLVREWHGTAHVVTIDEARQIHWNGKTWKSLSEIARVITGTRWSGPAFFGLKTRKAAA